MFVLFEQVFVPVGKINPQKYLHVFNTTVPKDVVIPSQRCWRAEKGQKACPTRHSSHNRPLRALVG